jgi:hypothetical protein
LKTKKVTVNKGSAEQTASEHLCSTQTKFRISWVELSARGCNNRYTTSP